MKKLLVLAAAFALLAGNAWALQSVVKSHHDMTIYNGQGYNGSNTEVCVFCHTPHGADTSNVNAPLWNRTGTGNTITKFYNSATLDYQSGKTIAGARINTTDAPLCLTCHDGSAAVRGSLLNPPNSGTVTWGASYTWTSQWANITNDLSDDHPIAMVYGDIYTNDSVGFNSLAEATASGVDFYDTNNVMWCSSCHDVHDDTYEPFLITNNAGSALCLACHNK